MADRYPLALYRDGNQMRVWDAYMVDLLVVHCADEELAAKRDGWRERPEPTHPLDHDKNGSPGGSLPKGAGVVEDAPAPKRGRRRK